MRSDTAYRSVSILEHGGDILNPRLTPRARGGDEVIRKNRELSFCLEILSACNLCWAKDNFGTEVLGDYWRIAWRAG